MTINLPDGSLHVDVFLDRSEPGYDDHVFVRITEECPEQYKLFRGHQITIGITAAEADIQRHFLVSAPTVNQMIQRLERLGLIARTPGQPRSIRLLVARQLIPPM